MITIEYNSNPNVPKEYNHCQGRFVNFREKDSRKFENADDALKFWQECLYPITPLEAIPVKLDVKTLHELQAEFSNTDNQLQEEYLSSQTALYNLDDDPETINMPMEFEDYHVY